MRHDPCLKFGMLAICLLACVVISICADSAKAQLLNGAVIISEQFEELYQVNPTSATATDLLNSPTFDEVFGHHLEIVNANTAYIISFDQLYKFDFPSGAITLIDQLSFNPKEITRGLNGSLIALDPNEVFRIDPTSGAETSLFTETFFSPNDAVVDSTGNIYLTEFFDALGVLTPSGNFSKIGNFSTNKFQYLDLGPDGSLYLSTTVGGSFYRVNPMTGAGTVIDTGVFTFIDDLQIDASGDILFAGVVDSKSGVFRFDTETLGLTTIVDQDTVNDGFFNPLDIAIFSNAESFETADFNKSGTVDGADLVHLLNAYGVGSEGDTDGDSDTDGADLLAWQRQFTGIQNNIVSQARAVPEPNSAILLIGYFLLLYLPGNRRRHQVCA